MLLDDAGRSAHKVCGEAALAAVLGQATREAGRRDVLNLPPLATSDHVRSYSLCKLCDEQELWFPPSQERGVCCHCWRAMDAEGTP
jgi:hypothetical protein